jgi:prepilin-type N-terminal cleavage/methylation domain-containing protein
MKTPAPKKSPQGFTLVEVAVAVFVLALAITTTITTMQRAFANLDTARNLSTASTILQTEMENERLLTWARLTDATYRPTLTDATYRPTLGAAYLRNPAVAGRFTISRTLTMLPDRSNQMVQVTLTVRWRNYDGRALTRSYTSYFTQGGLNDFYYLGSS